MATIKCDFYQVILPARCRSSFGQMIDKMSASRDDETRTIEYWDNSMLRFQGAQKVGDVTVAEMLRIKMKHLPVKAHINGTSEDFDLTKDQGSGESTHFVYNEATKTIVIHKSASGVPPGAIRLYFEGQCKVKEIHFNDWLDQDILAKLATSRNFRAFDIAINGDVAIASATNPALKKGRIGSIIRALLTTNTNNRIAPRLELRLSMGSNQKGSIGSNDDMIKEAHAYLAMNAEAPGSVQKLVITGSVDGIDEPKPLDLLKGKMVERITMPELYGRSYTSQDYRNALIQAWENRREEIEFMCGVGN